MPNTRWNSQDKLMNLFGLSSQSWPEDWNKVDFKISKYFKIIKYWFLKYQSSTALWFWRENG